MVWLVVGAVVVVLGLLFVDPDRSGAPLVEGLPRVPRGQAVRSELVTQAALVEVVSAPSGRWPVMRVSLGFWRNDAGPRWARVKVLEVAGQGPLVAGAEVGLTHGRLEVGQRFALSLNARGEAVDGYLAEADGRVRLVADDSSAAPVAPYLPTEPLPVAEALGRLVGAPPSTIPTKFRP